MTWPYRWLFKAKTAKTFYTLKKKMFKSTEPPGEVDVMHPIDLLTGNILNSNSNNCVGYPMSEMSDSGGGDSTIQNGDMAYNPVNSYLGRGDPTQGEGHLNPPHYPDAEQPFSCNPPVHQPNMPPLPSVAGMDDPAPHPPFPGYSAEPLPRAPPPSYEEPVVHISKPSNEHKLPAVQF